MTVVKNFWKDSRLYFLLSLLLVGILGYWAQFGFNFTDESFYAALPWRYINGARPFIEEYGVNQGYSWLLVPLAYIHKNIFSETIGYIYFLRLSFLIFHALTCLTIFAYLKKVTSVSNAYFWAFFHQLVIPYSIAALSYNTMALDFLILSFIASQVLRSHVLSGLLFFLTCLCFPPIAPLGLFFIFHLIQKKSGLKSFLIGCLGSVFFVALLLLFTGFSEIVESFRIHSSLNLQGKGSGFFLNHLGIIFQESFVGVLLVLAIHIINHFKSLPRVFLQNRFYLYLIVVLSTNHQWFYIETYLSSVKLASSLLPLFLIESLFSLKSSNKRLLTLGLIGLGGGLLTFWFSSNGRFSFYIGGASLILVLSQFENSKIRHIPKTSIAFSTPIIASLIYFLVPATKSANHLYRSPHISYLNSQISKGPFKGLYTTEEAAAHYNEIHARISELKKTYSKFIFFPRMPAGYLFIENKGHSPSTWILEQDIMKRDFIRSYFDINGLPQVIFISKRKPKWSKEEFWQESLSESDFLMILAKSDQYSEYYTDQNMEIYTIKTQ